jgi:hypothetical protein
MSYIGFKAPVSFRSSFNPVLGFSDVVLPKVNSFIEAKVIQVFRGLGINFDEVEYIETTDLITEKEFMNTSTELANSYFYELIFTNPKKLDDGSIDERVKFCITFDRDLTPYSKDDFNFGFIKIANRPVLYYIYIDLQELIRVSKT